MYFKDKTEIYKIRLTPEQSLFVSKMAKSLNCSKSEVFRKIIDSFRFGGGSVENK